jgi:hypothetical protein
MAEAIAYYDPGADITCQHVSGNVGGRCVGWPASRQSGGPSGISDSGLGVLVVDNPTANTSVFGVTSHDVAANGYVNVMRAPKVVPIECTAAVAIGDLVTTAADGRVTKSTTGQNAVGRALSVGATGTFAAILLFPYAVTAP